MVDQVSGRAADAEAAGGSSTPSPAVSAKGAHQPRRMTAEQASVLDAAANVMRDCAGQFGMTSIGLSFNTRCGGFFSASVQDDYRAYIGGDRAGRTPAGILDSAIGQFCEGNPSELERARKHAEEAAERAKEAASRLAALEEQAA